jgi:two-component system sensor kinase FixL
MPQGGRLSIAARAVREEVEVAVHDTGTGISADRLQHVMEPLYSTKAKGLGLGLAIAKSILERNNGRIAVESRPGEGSTFRVFLGAQIEQPG